MIKKPNGFTLIELLVVVLIIGVLTAIALPQYQTAVDKSRYATLMPVAKSVASAQEAFYMNGGHYSDDLAYLDVQLPNDPSGTIANVGDGLKVEISEDSDYGYVKMSKEGLENNYIIYQDNSLNYPKEIHCEALTGSERAERLCKTLGGSLISGSLTDGYDTYVLEGGGSGTPWSLAHADTGPAGWQQCDTYPCTKACTREVKAGYTCTGTYNEDHTYNELVCQGDICTSIDYTNEDKMTVKDTCIIQGNVCNVKKYETYDENGNKLRYRRCQENDVDGSCRVYANSGGYDYTYNENGKLTSKRYCGIVGSIDPSGECTKYSDVYEYRYDENGNQTVERHCNTGRINDSGECTSLMQVYDYTYDANGNQTAYRTCRGTSDINSSGDCTFYGNIHNYMYDENGKVTAYRACSSSSSKECASYNRGSDYVYDENGNIKSSRSCNGVNSNGSCKSYLSNVDYGYNENGKKTSERNCSGSNMKADGSCSSYSGGKDYTYDADGNMISERTCSSVNTDGNCSGYKSSGYDYAYDEQGTKIAQRYCSSWSGTNCNKWGTWYTIN